MRGKPVETRVIHPDTLHRALSRWKTLSKRYWGLKSWMRRTTDQFIRIEIEGQETNQVKRDRLDFTQLWEARKKQGAKISYCDGYCFS